MKIREKSNICQLRITKIKQFFIFEFSQEYFFCIIDNLGIFSKEKNLMGLIFSGIKDILFL